jgi:alkanesulfonate monooxygenase SsuD/methylene tetrahydromethanopterin reductase-like flavin-dependent oxidoreductase (luciferase family)
MGKKPTTLARLEETVAIIRDLTAGKQVIYQGQASSRCRECRCPTGVGCRVRSEALRCAGRIADGVIPQFADAHLIKWCLGFVREGAHEAGRDFSTIRVMSATAVWVSDDAKARQQVRWFLALVSNHVVDLISRYQPRASRGAHRICPWPQRL